MCLYDKAHNYIYPQKPTEIAYSGPKVQYNLPASQLYDAKLSSSNKEAKNVLVDLKNSVAQGNPKEEEDYLKLINDFFSKSNWDKVKAETANVKPSDIGGYLLFAATLINGLGLIKLGSTISQPSTVVGGIGLTMDAPFMRDQDSMIALGILYMSLAFYFAGLANNYEKEFADHPDKIRELDLSAIKNPLNWLKACGNSDNSKKIRKNIIDFIKFVKDDQILVGKSTFQSINSMLKYITSGFKSENKPDFLTLSKPTGDQYRVSSAMMAIGGPLVTLTSGIPAGIGHLCALFSNLCNNVGIYTWSKVRLDNPDKSFINACVLTKTGTEILAPILSMIGSSQGLQDILVTLKMTTFAGTNLRTHHQVRLEEEEQAKLTNKQSFD